MKLHLFAAAAAALLCAAPIVSADADALELNNLDFEEQKDSLLLDIDNFISESEGSEIRVRIGKADKPSPSPPRDSGKADKPSPSRPNPRPKPDRDSGKADKPSPSRTRRPTDREGKATSRPTRRPRGRSTRRPTRRPNRPPSSQRRTIRELMDHNWRFDQCVPRRRGMSSICDELDCYVCAQGRRNINSRMQNICERVGLPFRDQRNSCGNGSRRVRVSEAEEEIMAYAAEESDSMKSEDMDMDMEEVEVDVSESESMDEFDSIESEDTEFVSAAKATKSRRGISMSISRSGKSGKGSKMAVVFASE